MSPEFDLIARHFAKHGADRSAGVMLGVGDDCALLSPAPGSVLAVSTDTLVAGVHFFADVDPARLGHKSLAVNLSDLAAMGAAPRWFTLALTLPAIDHVWLAAFARGLFDLANTANIRLVGGDTTRGPLSMTLTVLGEAPSDQALRRDGAKEDDDIWVSGTLGDAALGLAIRQDRYVALDADRHLAIDRLELPTPRNNLGLALRGLATAAIDISDGLLADLGHLCERSALGANIRLAQVPMSDSMRGLEDESIRRGFILSGGDDYELCFTAPHTAHANIRELQEQLGLPLTCIGTMRSGQGVTVLDESGLPVSLAVGGFDHFSEVTHG